jgi:hypothetical protein
LLQALRRVVSVALAVIDTNADIGLPLLAGGSRRISGGSRATVRGGTAAQARPVRLASEGWKLREGRRQRPARLREVAVTGRRIRHRTGVRDTLAIQRRRGCAGIAQTAQLCAEKVRTDALSTASMSSRSSAGSIEKCRQMRSIQEMRVSRPFGFEPA